MKNLARGVFEIISGDPRMVCAGLAVGALIGALTVVLAVLVRAYWNLRIRKRSITINALVAVIAVDLLILGCCILHNSLCDPVIFSFDREDNREL
jgi:hypothetical protein